VYKTVQCTLSWFVCDGQNLDLLLKYIANIVEKHTDSEVSLSMIYSVIAYQLIVFSELY